MRTVRLFGAALLGGAMLSVGTFGGVWAATRNRTAPAYNPNASISLSITGDPNFNMWNPGNSVSSTDIDPAITLGLTTLGLNGAPAPSLAASWTEAKNGLSWTFHLRHNVKWSDGKPFSSADVVFTFDKIVLVPKLAVDDGSDFSSVKTVTAQGPNTVVFHLSAPDSTLPTMLAWFAPILPKHIFNGVKDPFKLSSYDEGNPVGTGPYMVKKYVPGSYVLLTRNPHYFGHPAKIKTLDFQIIPQPTTVTADLLNGTLNMVELAQPQLLKNFKSNPNFTYYVASKQVYYGMIMNFKDKIFNNLKFRQALDYAIDKKAIDKDVLQGYATISTGPIAPVQKQYYDPHVQTYPYNPSKAVALLESLGYKKGKGGYLYKDGKPLTLNLYEGQYQWLVPVAELVQNEWNKIGIKVNLTTSDWNSYIAKAVVKEDFQTTFLWWIAPYTPDIYTYFGCKASTADNYYSYCSPKLDKIMKGIQAATSQKQLKNLADEEQVYMAKQLPWLWMLDPEAIVVTTKSLHVPHVTYKLALFDVQNWYVSK